MDPTLTPESFEEAFDGLLDQAFRVALRLLASPEAAEDVAAEALARAYAHWPRISRLDYRDAWVLRVATNLAVDQLRRRPPAPVSSALAAGADETVVLRVALASALRSLPRRQRQAVVLQYLCDLPGEDVARVLRISPGSVKTHVNRGLAAVAVLVGAASQVTFDRDGYTVAAEPADSAADQPTDGGSPTPAPARPGDEVPSDPNSVPAPAGTNCPGHAAEPFMASGSYCGPEPQAGNGLGSDGVCTGRETTPPCGPGVEPGRWYPYTLAITCDAHTFLNGQRWRSTLGPPPAEEAPRHVWIRLSTPEEADVIGPTTAIGYVPDPDGPATSCAPHPAPATSNSAPVYGLPAPAPRSP